jgi:hypothetical protein
VVAEIIARKFDNVAYFPSYEIVTGPQARGKYFADDLREVTPAGVAHVMTVFQRHYLNKNDNRSQSVSPPQIRNTKQVEQDKARIMADLQIVCDEEILDA